tara:strand:- start:334 stop:612 length:279 start_codon:yes stop_codon:yes gene_type:complete
MPNISRGAVKLIDGDEGIAELTTDNNLQVMNMAQLVPEEYDAILIAYVATGAGEGEIEYVQYRTGGASGTIVAQISLMYTVDHKLQIIERTV